MASDVRETDVQQVFERHHVRYEVSPYYVVLDLRVVGAPPVERKVQAGFDVNVYGTLIVKEQFLPYHTDEARMVVDYFEKAAREIQSRVGQNCTIEVTPCADSVVLDTQQHLQPQVMLQIRISHTRGLDQAQGPSEEQALEAIRETLRELGAR
jgi:hypothetical protein